MNTRRFCVVIVIILLGESCSAFYKNPKQPQTSDLQAELMEDESDGNVYLQLTRDEKDMYRFPINDRSTLKPSNVSIVAVRDLDKNGEFEVILEILTPGSNCCSILTIVYFNQNLKLYESSNKLTKAWSIAPRMVDIDEDNIPEFVTRDSNYPWLAPPAFAVSPIQIFRFVEDELIDVTIEYPDLIKQDAILWLNAAQGEIADLSDDYLKVSQENPEYWAHAFGEGKEFIALSAYLADMYLLGKESEGWDIVGTVCNDIVCKQYFENLRNEFPGS